MDTVKQNQTPTLTGSALLTGVAADAVGSLVFGALMAMWNMLPMVGMLVSSESALVGFVVHMLISAFVGATLVLIATRIPNTTTVLVIAGALWGVVSWVLGALILMPIMLGMNEMVLQIGDTQVQSLIGHIAFGIVLGVAYKLISTRL